MLRLAKMKLQIKKTYGKMSGQITGGDNSEGIWIHQRVEMTGKEDFNALSFDVDSTGGGEITAMVWCYYGSGGSPDELVNKEKLTIPNGKSRQSMNIALPDFSTKTIGSGAYIEVCIIKQMGSTASSLITDTCNHTGDLLVTNTKLGHNGIWVGVSKTELFWL